MNIEYFKPNGQLLTCGPSLPMIIPQAVQQPWQRSTTSKDQAPAYLSQRGTQSQATRTLTASSMCPNMMRLQRQMFRPCWASSARCRVMLESEKHCTFISNRTVPHLCVYVCFWRARVRLDWSWLCLQQCPDHDDRKRSNPRWLKVFHTFDARTGW